MTKSQASPSSSAGSAGKILWNGNWVTFLDTLLHLIVLAETGRSLRLPTRIRSVYIDPVLHQEQVYQYQDNVEGNVFCSWAFSHCFKCCVWMFDFLISRMDCRGPSYSPTFSTDPSVTVDVAPAVYMITLSNVLRMFDANLHLFPVFQLLMLLLTAVLIASKQEVFRSMDFMPRWHHGDNRSGSLPLWKNSPLFPILRVTVCLPVPSFMPTWSTAKVVWRWFVFTTRESSSLLDWREAVHTTLTLRTCKK